MHKIILSFFLLAGILYADDLPYITSERDTLAIVDGVVNAYNGKLVQIDTDIAIQGSDPLNLLRYYDGGHHFPGHLGYGVGTSYPLYLTFDPNSKKKNVLVEQRGGSFLAFNAIKQKNRRYVGKVEPGILKNGYTNCCAALLRGEPDISTMQVDGTLDEFIVILGNGVKRYYEYCYTGSPYILFYRLKKEIRVNGNIRHYNYCGNESGYLKRIWTIDKDELLTLNWINFSYGKNYCIASASNGQEVRYELEEKKGTAKCKKEKTTWEIDYETDLLKKVIGQHLPETTYKALLRTRFEGSIFSVKNVIKPDGRSLNIEYDGCEKIKKLFLSGVDAPLYTFDYHTDHTNVTDALGNTKRFDFNKRRLTKLTEKHRSQHYTWSENGRLLSHTLNEPNGDLISKREYNYDEAGNIIETKVTANITKDGSNDCYIVRYAYSQDGRSNLLSENHNNEREFTYTYLPGTNLVTRKLTFADFMFVEREFYQYDNNGILIQKIVDDGSMADIDDLFNVTYRKVTEIEPQLNPNLSGMTLPKTIKESYLDPNTGQKHLLKIVERSYIQGDLLAEEKVYDANGQYCYNRLFEYNDRRRLVREIDPIGAETIYQYDDNGNRTFEEKIGSGKKIYYIYDTANRLIIEKEEHENGKPLITTNTYDSMGNRDSSTDRFGQTITFECDSGYRETSKTDPLGFIEYKEYDAEGRSTLAIDKEGYITKTIYNLYGKPLEIQYPDGTKKRFIYNLQGYLIQEWERDGRHVEYTVDYQGRPIAIRIYGSDGNFLKYIQRNYKGPNLTYEIDPLGNAIKYCYDGAGRKISEIQSGQSTYYEYDGLGRLYKTKTDDSVEIKEYDILDRVIEERTEDLSGNIYRKVQYTYDINGNPRSKKIYIDSQNYSEEKTVFNSENLPITEIDALGNITNIIYDYSDHLEKETFDPLGRRKLEIYDRLNRLSVVHHYGTDGNRLSHSSFFFDKRGHLILRREESLFQGQNFGIFAIVYSYDGMGQKIFEIEQDSRQTSYTYIQGQLHTITKSDNVVIYHYYDSLGRLAEQISSEGSIHYRYRYDLNDNLIGAEDVINKTDTIRSYDNLNRLVYEKQATGFQFDYSYDNLDRIKEISFIDGKIIYNYSPTTLISMERQKNDQKIYSYQRDTDWRGQTIFETLPNGCMVSYQWNLLGQCVGINSAQYNQSLTYDTVGNLISASVQDPLGSYNSCFAYDSLDQITKESGIFENIYAFDSNNNRREKNGLKCSIDGLNQLTEDGQSAYSYDLNGRRVSNGNDSYTYDALGRLIYFNDTEFCYDPLGRRTDRIDQNSTQYIYLLDTEIGICQNGDLQEFRVIYDEHKTAAVELGGVVYSPIRNHLRDICLLLDSSNNPQATYRYDVFGLFTHDGAIQSPWLFSGQRYDATIKLYHFAKREYDPSIGRWLTPDPLGFADGPNLYAYVHNNPLRYFDPYGLTAQEFIDGAAASFAYSAGSTLAYQGVITGAAYIYPPLGAGLALGYMAYTAGSLIYGGMDSLSGLGKTFLNEGFGAGFNEIKSGISNKINDYSQLSDSGKGAIWGSCAAMILPGTRKVFPLNVKTNIINPKNGINNFTNRSTSFFGSKRLQLDYAPYQKLRNSPMKINGRSYQGHSLDRMQDRGFTPSIIENTINVGKMTPNKIPGRIQYYDPVNQIRVITESCGEVVTVIPGRG